LNLEKTYDRLADREAHRLLPFLIHTRRHFVLPA
jgi:hypothetical protein